MEKTPVQEKSTSVDEELAILWSLVCALFVFFMQCGFALLESGAVRPKNVKNILLKNVIDSLISSVCWWGVGWAFSGFSACDQNGFIGTSNFFSSSMDSTNGAYIASWLFSWTFSATAATVVSGAVAERAQFKAYVIYTTVMCCFIYPVIVHWVWSPSGWLSARRLACGATDYSPFLSRTNGLLDFAGSGVVHMTGGGAALMGALILGPRLGRFREDGSVVHFEAASASNMTLGTFILWLGWYAFNAGSTGCFYGCMTIAAKVAANTTISVGASGLMCLTLAVIIGSPGDVGPLLNGVMAGAVSITAGCALVTTYAAFIIGIIGAFVYTGSSRLLLRLRIDDPLDASPVHFFCGAWGLLSTGFFATESSTQAVYHYANDWGVFYGGAGYQLGVQVLGIVAIAAWTCSISGALFLLLRMVGWLRVPREVEVAGLDFAQALTGRMFSKYTVATYWAYHTRVEAPQTGDSSRSRRAPWQSRGSNKPPNLDCSASGRSRVMPGAGAAQPAGTAAAPARGASGFAAPAHYSGTSAALARLSVASAAPARPAGAVGRAGSVEEASWYRMNI